MMKKTLVLLPIAAFFLLAFPVHPVITHAAQLGGESPGGTQLGGESPGGTQLGGSNPGCGSSGSGLQNPLCNTSTVMDLLNKVLSAVIVVGSAIIVLMLVYCGFLFVVAQGNEEKLRSARTALVWTVVGAIVLLGAKTISLVIANTVDTL